MVVAHLLKQQGHEVIGLAVLFAPKEEGPLDFPSELVFYRIPDANCVKRLCDSLHIPLYAVDAQDRYSYLVSDFLVSSLLTCQVFTSEVFATTLLMDILLEKAEALGAQAVATGHHAKIIHNKKNQALMVVSSDDEEDDQSHLLSYLDQKHLAKLILPLAQMRGEDVEKMASSIGGEFVEKRPLPVPYGNELLNKYMEAFVPRSLVKKGEVIHYLTGTNLGGHTGLGLYPGQTEFTFTNGQKLDPQLCVINYCIFKEKAFVCPKDKLHHTHIFLESLKITPGLDVSLAMDLFVKIASSGEKRRCRLIFKNNNTGLAEFDEPVAGLVFPGEFLVFHTKRGKGGQIIAAGLCSYCYFVEFNTIFRYPLSDEERESYSGRETERAEGF